MEQLDTTAVHDLLAGIHAERALREYFADGADRPTPRRFTGRRFDSLAGGGDRAGTQDRVTADDLVAVQLLSVVVPGETAIALLEGDLGDTLAGLLAQIPVDVALVDDATAPLVADGGPADQAWRLLTGQPDVGWVTAGKLLARKRPQLIPVYDDVVRCVLGHPRRFWTSLRAALRADDQAIHRRLQQLRGDAELPDTLSTLRVLDVVLWMRHHQAHRSGTCRRGG